MEKETGDSINEVDKITQDTKPLKKHNKVAVIGGTICAVCALGTFYYFKVYDGGFHVSQSVDTYELGSEQDILNSLKYDERKIVDVSIVDKDNFSIDKIGDYTVTFDLMNNRKNHKQVSYTYYVVDTIAPKLTVEQTEIYLAKGHNFDLNMYASSTDASNTDVIKYDENFDKNVPGTYTLNIYAEDESDNKSASQPVTVVVEDRDNCDVNLANFGDSREVVKRYETHEIASEGDDMIVYIVEDNGRQGYLDYEFTDDDKLCEVMYVYQTDYENDAFINMYSVYKQDMANKYGTPSISKENYDKSLSAASALWLGRYIQTDTWDLENKKIVMALYNSNYVTTLAIKYDSKEYAQ